MGGILLALALLCPHRARLVRVLALKGADAARERTSHVHVSRIGIALLLLGPVGAVGALVIAHAGVGGAQQAEESQDAALAAMPVGSARRGHDRQDRTHVSEKRFSLLIQAVMNDKRFHETA